MKKRPPKAEVPQKLEPARPEKMTREMYIASLREHYLNGTLDEVLWADFDVPDSLVEAIFPELYRGRYVH